jgi:hypothetical protein
LVNLGGGLLKMLSDCSEMTDPEDPSATVRAIEHSYRSRFVTLAVAVAVTVAVTVTVNG